MTRRPFTSLPANVRGDFVGHLAERGTWRASVPQPVKCSDPRDRPLLALAVSGGAGYIVTGDDDLRSLEQVGGVKFGPLGNFSGKLKNHGLLCGAIAIPASSIEPP